ncbi:hypothetical protein F4780DRAFT_324961 [Xylariomycetidae sp. FL0641]|nr:hypothetical protein F4780DRAFT_324961 [Xylariomycetidae sp. FL0641]
MRSRLQKLRPSSHRSSTPTPPTSSPAPQDLGNDAHTAASRATPIADAQIASRNNSMSSLVAEQSYSSSPTLSPTPRNNSNVPSTIRTVPSFEAPSEYSSSDSPSVRNSGFSSSIHSNASGASYISQVPPTNGDSNLLLKPDFSPRPQSSTSFKSSSEATTQIMNGEEETLPSQVAEDMLAEDHAHADPSQWNSAVGKAGLGKTGRVIDKLVSDNEALKRDIKLERLKADESKQAAKLVEDKMDRMASDFESRLLEANVTKTLLSRKERQVEHLQSAIEAEKKRATDAQDRERVWKEELERGRRSTKVQVEEANTQAALMEGRYNAISSHWRDQGNEVKQAMTKLNGRIETLVEERRKDDEKINVLRDLCDQQDGNIRDLKRQKDEISEQFEAYKREQETVLQDIKRKAREREEEQTRTIEETKEVLNKLKWALNVKKNVPGAG